MIEKFDYRISQSWQHFVIGLQFEQYQDYIPVPSVEKSVCNSSLHYNGKLNDNEICTGARADRRPCRVRILYC